jgi:hypothetical protein
MKQLNKMSLILEGMSANIHMSIYNKGKDFKPYEDSCD